MTSLNKNNDIPQYLTKEYVENILKNYFKDSTVKVLNMEITPATAKGESFCSVMTRMKVNYKSDREKVRNQIHVIVKSTYDNNPHLSDVLRQYDVFNTEMQMYEKVLPQMEQMLQEIGDMDQLCAPTIYVDYDHNIIVFEDLAERKFTMANRLEGIDENHLKLCLRKLAKFHASAAVLNDRQAGVLEKFSHGIYNRHVNIYGEFVEKVMKVSAKFAANCPELGPYYGDKIAQLIPHAVEYVTRCFDPNPNHFLTLNHGDIWTNNVMVKYENEKGKTNLKDILLIDFQYCCWTSPAVDLHYFLTTSSQDDLLLSYKSKFIQYYHRVLSENLVKLKYSKHIPSLHELNVQLLERAYFAVSCTLVNLPLLINDKTEDADFETILGSGEKSQRLHNVIYTNKRIHKILKNLLPKYDELGLLDIVK